MKVYKDDYLLFKDSFNTVHVGIVTSEKQNSFNNKIEISVIVLKSITESNLNTALIEYSNIEMKFDKRPNLNSLEEDYPEFWI